MHFELVLKFVTVKPQKTKKFMSITDKSISAKNF